VPVDRMKKVVSCSSAINLIANAMKMGNSATEWAVRLAKK